MTLVCLLKIVDIEDTPSLKGRFTEDSITLQSGNKEVYKTFNFEVVSVRKAGWYEPVYDKYQSFGDRLTSEVITEYRKVDLDEL